MQEANSSSTLKSLADGSLVATGRETERYDRKATSKNGTGDDRTPTERDRGRLGYSAYLRRLAGVTQVVSPELASSQMHSRSSHTHKVAMIAREIADHVIRGAARKPDWHRVIENAGGLDIAACEAAGLAHDIGHPPFGHAGEDALDQYLKDHDVLDGFEGNAQTFRTVTRLDLINEITDGLNLTNVTLAAILKYPYAKRQPYSDPDNRKFGAYLDDVDGLHIARAALRPVEDGRQTLEASIMDLADDIAYAIHDLEDFLTAGLIDVGLVKREINDSLVDAGIDQDEPDEDDFKKAVFEDVADAYSEISDERVFVKAAIKHRKGYAPLYNDQDYAAALHDVRAFLDDLGAPDTLYFDMNLRLALKKFVSRFFTSIEVRDEPPYADGPSIFLASEAWHQMQVLKSITRHYLVSRPRMGSMQRAQSKAIENLMDGLAQWVCTAPKKHTLPPTLLLIFAVNGVEVPENRHSLDDLTPKHYRALADYVCTMSDSEALMRSQWLSGTEVPGSFRLALS